MREAHGREEDEEDDIKEMDIRGGDRTVHRGGRFLQYGAEHVLLPEQLCGSGDGEQPGGAGNDPGADRVRPAVREGTGQLLRPGQHLRGRGGVLPLGRLLRMRRGGQRPVRRGGAGMGGLPVRGGIHDPRGGGEDVAAFPDPQGRKYRRLRRYPLHAGPGGSEPDDVGHVQNGDLDLAAGHRAVRAAVLPGEA